MAVDRVLFIHVQRTGGTSLRRALEAEYGEQAVHPSTATLASLPNGFYQSGADVLADWESLPPHRFLFGHFVAAVAEVLPERYRTATFLRDPVERSISIVLLRARISGRAVNEIIADEDFLSTHVADLQTRVFGMGLERGVVQPPHADPADDAMLDRAVERLGTFDFVAFTDDLASSVAAFDTVFGTSVSPRFGHENAAARDGVSIAELAAVFEPLVQRDRELVAAARARFA
jgi:hypothetical protein